MNLYTRKKITKIGILLMAVFIIGISYFAVDSILLDLKKEEARKIEMWYQTIQKKSELINKTQVIFDSLKQEEYKKVLLWREAVVFLTQADLNKDITFTVKVIQNNTSIPIIQCDAEDRILQVRNLPKRITEDSLQLDSVFNEMKKAYPPIEVSYLGEVINKIYFNNSELFFNLQNIINDLTNEYLSDIADNSLSVPVILTDSTQQNIIKIGNELLLIEQYGSIEDALINLKQKNKMKVLTPKQGELNYLFVEDSEIIQKLKIYPWLGWGLVLLFLAFTYFMFSTYRKAEQDNVWVGMAKETAHQLGTPISSLMAWQEILKEDIDENIYIEIKKDIHRLAQVSERFGKIGSIPDLKPEAIGQIVENSINYFKKRTPKNIELIYTPDIDDTKVLLSPPLFTWVIENVLKNAIDAIHSKDGIIHVSLMEKEGWIHLSVEDNGCGIEKSNLKSIFKPGITTKKRGWGLGLSLAKRIISDFHKGKIFIEESTPGKGTLLKIELKSFVDNQ